MNKSQPELRELINDLNEHLYHVESPFIKQAAEYLIKKGWVKPTSKEFSGYLTRKQNLDKPYIIKEKNNLGEAVGINPWHGMLGSPKEFSGNSTNTPAVPLLSVAVEANKTIPTLEEIEKIIEKVGIADVGGGPTTHYCVIKNKAEIAIAIKALCERKV